MGAVFASDHFYTEVGRDVVKVDTSSGLCYSRFMENNGEGENMSKCHCGRDIAMMSVPVYEFERWVNDAVQGDTFWLDMGKEFCEPCWQTRCDVEGECPAKYL